MKTFDENFLKEAHRACGTNQATLEKSSLAGCCYCKKIFSALSVEDWIDDRNQKTALCPTCSIDAVIGDASGVEITPEFLNAMHEMWFGRTLNGVDPVH